MQYLGNWYQYEGLPAFFAPSGTSCIRATYGANGKCQILSYLLKNAFIVKVPPNVNGRGYSFICSSIRWIQIFARLLLVIGRCSSLDIASKG